MNIDKFTDSAKNAIAQSQTHAAISSNQQIMPIHLLKSLLEDDSGVIRLIISNIEANYQQILEQTNKQIDNLVKIQGANKTHFSNAVIQILDAASKLAIANNDSFVTTQRIMQAMTQSKDVVAQILANNNIDAKNIKIAIDKITKGRFADSSSAEQNYNALTKYGRNITQLAMANKLDPIIGREDEIRRTIQVLSRRTKNNPVLIGEPGVGKTAIIEGLAQRIIAKDVPEAIVNCQIFELDIGALIAGAKFRGEFEERLKSVLNEIKESSGQIILFIDEIHLLVGAGKSDGAMDAANLLKPMLARGQMHCIGATTLDEYRMHVEKDAALARRFQAVYVNEPSVMDTISILRGLKSKYELHHGIEISDSAIIAAATFSDRYITDRFLPDKAIDLLDEAASRLKIQISSKPEELDALERKIMQIKIEVEALKKEKDAPSQDKSTALSQQLIDLERKAYDLNTKWIAEKAKIKEIHKIKEDIEQVAQDLELAQRAGDLAKAGELKYSILPKLQHQLVLYEAKIGDTKAMMKENIDDQDIAIIISRATGIPVDKMLTSDKQRLLAMEQILSEKIIGQQEAISAVSNAIRRSRSGICDTTKPIASFLFLGPTGVGKTELAKTLAWFLFDSSDAMIRIDMSEYMEKHTVSKLIGSPPGYVGYEQGGILTESVRRRPYQVILFDEAEKAHSEVFDLLLQILDDGRLTDSHGRVVDFKNTIIIMTSNLGSSNLLSMSFELAKKQVMDDVRHFFKPEFLNRIDDILFFHPLTLEQIKQITRIHLKNLQALLQKQYINCSFDEKVVELLSTKGYDPIYGARPLKRVIQAKLQNEIAKIILSQEIKKDQVINISTQGDEIVIILQ